MRSPVLLAALVAAVACLTAAGCGGGGDEPEGTAPAEWAAGVCGALDDWQSEIASQAGTLDEELKGARNVPALRRKLVGFLDATVAATDRMLREFDAVGQPAVDEGEELHRDFRKNLTDARRSLARARDRAKALPNNAQAFKRGADELGETIGEEFQAVGGSLEELDEKYDAKELDEAFEEEQACEDL